MSWIDIKPYTCCVIWSYGTAVTVRPARWLLMAWCLFSARTFSVIGMAWAGQRVSEVAQHNDSCDCVHRIWVVLTEIRHTYTRPQWVTGISLGVKRTLEMDVGTSVVCPIQIQLVCHSKQLIWDQEYQRERGKPERHIEKKKKAYKCKIIVLPAWICNYISNKVWDEIIYQFPNFSCAIVEV